MARSIGFASRAWGQKGLGTMFQYLGRLPVVGAEREQRELGVLQRRRGGQQPGHLVHQLLQLVAHGTSSPVQVYEPSESEVVRLSLVPGGIGP